MYLKGVKDNSRYLHVGMHAHMYVCMLYVCVCLFVYVCNAPMEDKSWHKHVWMYICMCLYYAYDTPGHLHVRMAHVCIHVHMYMHACIQVMRYM
jgi:hypothetical protein